jgi:hypothetical protein
MDQGIVISENEIKYASAFLRKSPVIYTCRNVIQHHLFSNGIVFAHRRGRIRPDPHMQEIMTDFWLPFCRNMVDAILALGIVAIRIVELDDGLRVPVVLEANSCQIKMKYDLGIREYICLDQQRDEIPNTLVLDSFGFSPNIAGKLTSIIANLLPQIQYINTLRGTCLAMEQKRTSPIIMTETVDTKVDNVEGVNYDYYADGDMQDNSDQNKFMRNRSSVQQLQQQQQMYDSFFSEGHMPSKGSSALENVVTLPLGHKIVNMPQQTGRGDLCAQIKAHDDLICAVMGIPRSLVMSDTPHKTDAEGTHQTFQKTIMFWKNSIQTACEQIYNVIYADKIKEQMMKVIGKKRKKSTVEDVYALKKRMQVEISFPISPFIGPDQLYIHYQRGTITWERYQEHACAAAALPHEPLPEPTDPEPSDVTVSKENPEKTTKEKPEKKKIEDSDSEGED